MSDKRRSPRQSVFTPGAPAVRNGIAQVHAKLDASDLTNIDGLNKAMTSLTIEHDTLARIPTWPWQPETPRILFTAVMVPVVLWLLQRILERIMTP
jgi:hypothetical protein